jgi:hypothetical protein
MSRAIVIFARAPEVEACVKRLPSRFAGLFDRNTAAWLRAASLAGATPIVSCAARARFDAIESSIARLYIEQSGATFGERLASTAEAAFALGFDEVLVTGIDAPPVRVREAFAALRHARAVIEPSDDGGINLIALRAPERELLSSIRPRQRDVVERCRAYFSSLVVLDVSTDVDSLAVGCWPLAETPRHVDLPPSRRRHLTRPPPSLYTL